MDGSGALYIADAGRIRRVDGTTGIITTVFDDLFAFNIFVYGSGTLYFAESNKHRIYKVIIPPPTVIPAVVDEGATYTAFSLDPNFPNPFNNSTVFRFAVSTQNDVVLSIYNLVGQPVATLVDGPYAAGLYTVRWDGRDDAGRSLASGVYLYLLKTESQITVRKLVLAR